MAALKWPVCRSGRKGTRDHDIGYLAQTVGAHRLSIHGTLHDGYIGKVDGVSIPLPDNVRLAKHAGTVGKFLIAYIKD